MNENIDLTKILKDCPKGFKLYSPICGTVTFEGIDYHDSNYPICVKTPTITVTFSKKGLYFYCYGDSECCLFPSSGNNEIGLNLLLLGIRKKEMLLLVLKRKVKIKKK